ncbi:hypothetical protein UZ36_02350 [Candidatus Nitromaritima sp. SCGC AAA799-C22]|nr:hypothetical protein UZ36_02350 [Candidatus Nitromaritima sp. SCGC AAA799-C22]
MNDKVPPVYIDHSSRLPLLTDFGRAFTGLKNSSSPELVERTRTLFEFLSGRLGFPDSAMGRENQECFNTFLRSVYPEVMIDLADLVYVQHERLAVFLSFDHINLSLKKDLGERCGPLEPLNEKMAALFYELARTLLCNPGLSQEPEVVRLLSESYSYYLYQTENFPWEDPVQPRPLNLHQPALDTATGLAGFSMIHNWPDNFPALVLADSEPFIVRGLSHYLGLTGKSNVKVVEADFPSRPPQGMKFGLIMSNKFLHHLQRPERIRFFQWCMNALEPDGTLGILDTDLEYQILQQSRRSEFKDKLTVGYLDTLVEIESDFADTLEADVKASGFRITHSERREYHDETDAYSQNPGETLSLTFTGLEIAAEKPAG